MILVEGMSLQVADFRLEGINISVEQGEYAALMGKTGSGKTTILEAICGLRRVSKGRIVLCGCDVTNSVPGARGVGYVPQECALFSDMTVGEHLGFALTIRRESPGAVAARVDELAEMLGLSELRDRYPDGLSGGEAQRVALGRALSFRPKVLCLDEPLSSLDEETRDDIRKLLKSVQDITKVTTLHVTHSHKDATLMADKIIEVRDGQIVTTDA